jgi:3-oxoacyl-[acyl-carrier protein] reductase
VGVIGAGTARDDLVSGLARRGVTTVAAATAFDLPDVELTGLVWAAAAAEFGTPRPLVSLDAEQWDAVGEQPLRDFVHFMQSAHARLRTAGGSVVVVIPTIAMTGAAGLAPWAAVADGQRSLAKSAARVWGTDGITVNCIAVPAALLVGASTDISRPDLQNSALHEPDLADVAGAVCALLSAEMQVVSGATISVDGGRWMNP